MIEATLYTAAGAKAKGAFALPAETFDGTVNRPVLHQVVRAYRNNQRQGTAATKTRSFVSGGNQKPWRQKGTGRARQGSTRAPHWRGGGVVFGPHPRDYTTGVPRKVKALARKSALNARAGEGALHVLERVALEGPKTKAMVALLEAMGLAGRKVLLLTHGVHRAAWLSGRNVPRLQVMPWSDVSAYDVLWSDAVVVEQGALTGEAPTTPLEADTSAPAPAKPKSRAAAKAKAAKAAKPARAAAPRKAKAAAPKTAKAAKAPAKKAAKKAAPKKKGK
ncbi:MAG TPA: 50S ribosomal protein L4 [Gemmatimonadales bacterium]|nr:50S ribosomal protein L4 [Gemmatimonadales bacterium]